MIGGGSFRVIKFVGGLDLVFHGIENVRITLHDVASFPSLPLYLFLLTGERRLRGMHLYSTGVHVIGGRLPLPHGNVRSKLILHV